MYLFIEIPYDYDVFFEFGGGNIRWLQKHNDYDGVSCYQFRFNLLDRMESANKLIDYCTRLYINWHIIEREDTDEEYWEHLSRFSEETLEEYQCWSMFCKLFNVELP